MGTMYIYCTYKYMFLYVKVDKKTLSFAIQPRNLELAEHADTL